MIVDVGQADPADGVGMGQRVALVVPAFLVGEAALVDVQQLPVDVAVDLHRVNVIAVSAEPDAPALVNLGDGHLLGVLAAVAGQHEVRVAVPGQLERDGTPRAGGVRLPVSQDPGARLGERLDRGAEQVGRTRVLVLAGEQRGLGDDRLDLVVVEALHARLDVAAEVVRDGDLFAFG